MDDIILLIIIRDRFLCLFFNILYNASQATNVLRVLHVLITKYFVF